MSKFAGYSEEDKTRIKNVMTQLAQAKMRTIVLDHRKKRGRDMSDAQFDQELKAILPSCFETARATVNAVNEFLS